MVLTVLKDGQQSDFTKEMLETRNGLFDHELRNYTIIDSDH